MLWASVRVVKRALKDFMYGESSSRSIKAKIRHISWLSTTLRWLWGYCVEYKWIKSSCLTENKIRRTIVSSTWCRTKCSHHTGKFEVEQNLRDVESSENVTHVPVIYAYLIELPASLSWRYKISLNLCSRWVLDGWREQRDLCRRGSMKDSNMTRGSPGDSLRHFYRDIWDDFPEF